MPSPQIKSYREEKSPIKLSCASPEAKAIQFFHSVNHTKQAGRKTEPNETHIAPGPG